MAVFWVVAIALTMEAAQSAETSVNSCQCTRRYNSEDSHLHSHRRESLKSYQGEVAVRRQRSGRNWSYIACLTCTIFLSFPSIYVSLISLFRLPFIKTVWNRRDHVCSLCTCSPNEGSGIEGGRQSVPCESRKRSHEPYSLEHIALLTDCYILYGERSSTFPQN
jgi:hypothetical protein